MSSQTNPVDEFLKFPLKTISTYCQNKLDTAFSTAVLTYDKENNLIKYSWYNDTIESSRTVFNYNALGFLVSKDFYSYSNNSLTLTRTRLYKYDEKNRLIYEGYDDERGNNTKNNYSYGKNGELISSKNECNYNKWNYSYEYDSNGRLRKKYKNNELEVSYEYSQNHLTKEIHYNRNSNKEILYVYDDNGLLINKREKEKLIENNIYNNGRLVERWTYYFGIDPCYSPCCGQYFTKYEYY